MKIEQLAEKFNIDFIVIFGSVAEGNSSQESDFDVAIYCERFKNLDDYTEVLFELAKILNVSSDKIDLTNLKYADILLRYEITLKGKLIYGDEERYLNYCAFAYNDYIDAKDFFKFRDELLKKKNKKLQNYVK